MPRYPRPAIGTSRVPPSRFGANGPIYPVSPTWMKFGGGKVGVAKGVGFVLGAASGKSETDVSTYCLTLRVQDLAHTVAGVNIVNVNAVLLVALPKQVAVEEWGFAVPLL